MHDYKIDEDDCGVGWWWCTPFEQLHCASLQPSQGWLCSKLLVGLRTPSNSRINTTTKVTRVPEASTGYSYKGVQSCALCMREGSFFRPLLVTYNRGLVFPPSFFFSLSLHCASLHCSNHEHGCVVHCWLVYPSSSCTMCHRCFWMWATRWQSLKASEPR